MAQFADCLRLAWVPHLVEASKESTPRLREVIAGDRYIAVSLTGSSSMVVQHADRPYWVEPLLFEAGLHTRAMIETTAGVERRTVMPRSAAWLAVELYYAAFYAANALTRVGGCSVSTLDSAAKAKLTSQFATLGNPVTLGASRWVCEVDRSNPGRLAIQPDSSSDGHHVRVWMTLLDYLDRCAQAVSSSSLLSGQKTAFAVLHNDLRSVLCYSGNARGNWLSVVRNNVQYRFGWDSWLFDTKRDTSQRIAASCVKLRADAWVYSPPSFSDEVERFVWACCSLVALQLEQHSDLVDILGVKHRCLATPDRVRNHQ